MIIFKKIFFHFVDILLHVLPMRKDYVLFTSFHGLYNDNPRYISEKLHELYPDIKIFWVIDERANIADIPEYINKVRRRSFSYVYYKNRSKVLIDNFEGFICSYSKHGIILNKLFIKKGQVNFSTWHGTPLKKIGFERYGSKIVPFSTSTCFMLNSKYIANIFNKYVNPNIPIKLLGSPRNDLLFEKREDIIIKCKEKLGLPIDKKIVIYAPTYRSSNKNVDGKTFSIYLSKNDIERCLVAFKNRFGGQWVFVCRVHNMVGENMADNIDNSHIFNGNLHDDMAEYLLSSDALITDYSGSLFDYTITQKPCFLYTPDYEDYRNAGRGIYMDIEKLPYPNATDIDRLTAAIENFNDNMLKDKIHSFNKKMGLVDDGNASYRIAIEIKNALAFK